VGSAYNASLAATGGTPPYAWSISTGAPPAGLSLNGSSGAISGSHTGPPGTTSFTATVADRSTSPQSTPQPMSIAVSPPLPTNCTTYSSPATGSHQVCGAILAKYQSLGGPAGFLGNPTTDETGTPDGVGRFNHFSSTDNRSNIDGSIYWTAGTGAGSVHGAIRAKWASLGWERSCLGDPLSDEFAISGGRQSNFQRGVISYSFASARATASCG
jgi:uncharacterized protein with LGFP repeats